MKKVFNAPLIIIVILLGTFLVPVRAEGAIEEVEPLQFPSNYQVTGESPTVSNGNGVSGTLKIYAVDLPHPPPEGTPIPAYWINLDCGYGNNNIEGGLQAYYSTGTSEWRLRIYMSYKDNGVETTLPPVDIGWPCTKTVPYTLNIKLYRDSGNLYKWYMDIQHPGGSWEYFNSHTYQQVWYGNNVWSQTEGNVQPSQGQVNQKVGEFINLKYMNSQRIWVS